MISASSLKTAYNNLYVQLRRYIWDFEVVEQIADLEVESYKAFPDTKKVSDYLSKLSYSARDLCRDDEDLAKAFSEFEEILNTDDSVYVKLYSVSEVL